MLHCNPNFSREQDKGSLQRGTNIWLKSWTESLHKVFFEQADETSKK